MTHQFDYCVVGLRCLDQLLGVSDPKYIGGVERQICTLAKLLKRAGKSVAFISYGDSTVDQSVEGIQVFGAYVEDVGVRFIRFVYPQLTGLWTAMRRANARVYVQMGAGAATGMVGLGTKVLWPTRPRKFVFMTASNTDTDLSRLKHLHERIFYRIGLRASDTILTQTNEQQALLERNLQYSSTVVELPFMSQDKRRRVRAFRNSRISIIWVGRLMNFKRPEWVIELAASCPEMHFDIVGPSNTDNALTQSLECRASTLPNVTLHGRVSEERLREIFGSAFALCCTSEIEGFPTTFLEAWYLGLPIVTTFDPDNMIADNELGFVNSTVEGLAESLTTLVVDRRTYEKMSNNAYDLFTRRYSEEACATKLLSVLDQAPHANAGKDVSE